MNEQELGKSKSESTKKPYARPTLVEYGRVSKLVQGWGSAVPEGYALRSDTMFDPHDMDKP